MGLFNSNDEYKIKKVNEQLAETSKKTSAWVDVTEYEHLKVPVDNDYDWLPAFEQAYLDARDNRKQLLIPSGTYYLSNTFEVDQSNFHIEGKGDFFDGAVLTNKDGNYATLRIKGTPTTKIRRVMATNLRVYGQIHLLHCVDLWFKDIFANFGHTHTLHIQSGWSYKFEGCHFQFAKNGHDVYIDHDTNDAFSEVNALTFLAPRIEAGNGSGIYSNPETKVMSLNVFGGIIEGYKNGWGIDIARGEALTFNGVYFEGNKLGNGKFGTSTKVVNGLNMFGILNHGYGEPRPPVGIHCVNVKGGIIHGNHLGFDGTPVLIEKGSTVEVKGAEPNADISAENKPVVRLGINSGLNKLNLARNPSFERWNATNTMPLGWFNNSGTAIVTKDTLTTNSIGSAMKLTYDAGVNTSCSIAQRYAYHVDQLKGKTLYVGVMAKTNISGRFRMRVNDGVGSYYSKVHSGNDKWQMVGRSVDISPDATNFQITLEILTGVDAMEVFLDDLVVLLGEDFSGSEMLPSSPSEFYNGLSGTVSTSGSPATATVTHYLGHNSYNVQLTTSVDARAWYGKSNDSLTITSSSACNVDYVITKI